MSNETPSVKVSKAFSVPIRVCVPSTCPMTLASRTARRDDSVAFGRRLCRYRCASNQETGRLLVILLWGWAGLGKNATRVLDSGVYAIEKISWSKLQNKYKLTNERNASLTKERPSSLSKSAKTNKDWETLETRLQSIISWRPVMKIKITTYESKDMKLVPWISSSWEVPECWQSSSCSVVVVGRYNDSVVYCW